MVKHDSWLQYLMQLDQAINYYLEPKLREKGYELVRAVHEKHKHHGIKITLFIDRYDGQPINYDDCGHVTQIAKEQFETLLEDYLLEVSSPGVDRPIKTPEHFRRFQGRHVKITLKEPVEDQKTYSGIIETSDDIHVVLRLSGIDAAVNVPYTNIQKANLVLSKK